MNLSEFIKKLQHIESFGMGENKVICDGIELTEDDIHVHPTDKTIILRTHLIDHEDVKKILKLKNKINKAIEEFDFC